ncbi:hypothetical protein, partial [Proteus mirabilis]|uniref:hypothetical protein n=1 Tax=Proteus mirabilis TaxID=584 RepID=UPI001952C9FB
GFLDADDPDGFILGAVQTDFGSHDFAVQAVLALWNRTTVGKRSDGVDLSTDPKARGPNKTNRARTAS